jgi:hypothetical protein
VGEAKDTLSGFTLRNHGTEEISFKRKRAKIH